MLSVKIRTFTGKEEDYQTGLSLRNEIITQQLPMENLDRIDQYYETHKKVPAAWRELWTCTVSGYDRVALLYDCKFATLDEQNQAQHWQAIVAFMYENTVVSLLLVSTNALLRQLWEEHHPHNFELRAWLTGGPVPLVTFYPLEKYLLLHNINVSTEYLWDNHATGLNDNTQYRFTEDHMGMLAAMVARHVTPEAWAMDMKQLKFFSGEPEDYEPNQRSPFHLKGWGEDFSAVDTYYARQSTRPKVWHELWTRIPGSIALDCPFKDEWRTNYDRVVTLNSCNFVTIEQDGTEVAWAGAVVFMRGSHVYDVLMVKTALHMFLLYGGHHPRNFEFVYPSRSSDFQTTKPLSKYLSGELTGKPVAMQSINAYATPIQGTRIQMSPAGINAFGVALTDYLRETLGLS